ncbi:MAG: hypothetical protein R3F29_06860 [Planctomycetota bacterium]
MRTRTILWLLPWLCCSVLRGQDANAGRERAVGIVSSPSPDETGVAANAAGIVDLLCDPDRAVRHRALAAVMRFPEAVVGERARLREALASAPDDCVLRAMTALAPFRPLSFEAALQLVDSGSLDGQQQGLRGLEALGDEILPHLDAVVARLDRFGSQPRWLQLLKNLMPAHRAEVLAAVNEGMSRDRRVRASSLVRVLHELDAGRDEVEAAVMTELRDDLHGDFNLQQQLVRDSATLRARLAERLPNAGSREAQRILMFLERSAATLAEQWPQLRKLLGSTSSTSGVVNIGVTLAAAHPQCADDLLAAVPTVGAEALPALAHGLARLPQLHDRTVTALAARLPLPGTDSLPVIDVLIALDGQDELRALLPALLGHDQPSVRARACQLCTVLGERQEAIAQSLARLQDDQAAPVRTEAQLALRYLRGEVADSELADHVRDRDPHRVLGASCHLRRSHARFHDGEAVAFATLVATPQFAQWAQRTLKVDLDAGRVDEARCITLLSTRDSWAVQVGTPYWGSVPPPPRPPTNPALLELASRDQGLRDALLRAGAIDPSQLGAAPPSHAERAASLLAALGSADTEQRELALQGLARMPRQHWYEAALQLRRSGNRMQRRLLACTLEKQPRAVTWQMLEGPESTLMVRALGVLLAAGSPDPADLERLAAHFAAAPVQFCELLANHRQDLLERLAPLGEPAAPLLRAAMADPRCRSRAIAALRFAGPVAQEFVPELIRALRATDCAAAGATLLAVGVDEQGPHWQTFRDAVEVEWQQPTRRRLLLPALCALGDEHDDFAERDLPGVLRDVRGDLRTQLSKADQAWLDLALASDADTRERVARLFLLAWALESDGRRSQLSNNAGFWRGAASTPGLRDAMVRLFDGSTAEERRRMLGPVLDAIADARAVPASDWILEHYAEEAFAVAVAKQQHFSPMVVRALAAAAPAAVVAAVVVADDGGARWPNAALQALPRDPRAIAALAERLVTDIAGPPSLRPALAVALVAQGDAAEPAIRTELEAGGERQRTMLDAIARAGAAAQFAVPAITANCDQDPSASHRALMRLGAAGIGKLLDLVPPSEHVPWLKQAVHSQDDEAVAAALRLLQQLAPEDAEQAARMHYRRPGVRRWAGFILLAADAPVDPALVLALGRDELDVVRRRAAQALAGLESWPAEVGTLATDLLADPDRLIRHAAVQGFARHPEEIAASRIALQEAAAAETDAIVAGELKALLESR